LAGIDAALAIPKLRFGLCDLEFNLPNRPYAISIANCDYTAIGNLADQAATAAGYNLA
jgi:hypothetical protein